MWTKILKVAALAVSAESVGSTNEARAAGLRAGQLARQHGLALDALWAAEPRYNRVGGVAQSCAWDATVDGYYS